METTSIPRNVARFIAATGKTENDYYLFATEVGRKIHINKLDALVCAKLGIYTVAHLRYRATELPGIMSEADAIDYLRSHSENPYELGKLWLEEKGNAERWICKESILAEHLSAFPKEGFYRFGDKNHIDGVARSWFHKEGVDLDVQLLEINGLGIWGAEISIQDAIDFVMKYRPGAFRSGAELRVKSIEDRFRAVTSFNIKDYYVQHLIRMCERELVDNGFVPF